MQGLLLPLLSLAAFAQTPEVKRLIDDSRSQRNQGHTEEAVKMGKQAIELSRSTSDKKGLERAYTILSGAYLNAVQFELAYAAAMEGLPIAEEIGDTEGPQQQRPLEQRHGPRHPEGHAGAAARGDPLGAGPAVAGPPGNHGRFVASKPLKESRSVGNGVRRLNFRFPDHPPKVVDFFSWKPYLGS